MDQSLTKLTPWDKQRPCLCCIGKQVVENYVSVCCMHAHMPVCMHGKHMECTPTTPLRIHPILSAHIYRPNVYLCLWLHVFVNAFIIYIFEIYVPMYSSHERCEKEKNWKGGAICVPVNLNITYTQKEYGMQIYVNKPIKMKCIRAHLRTLHICTDTYPVCLRMCISIFLSSMFMCVCI